MMLRLNRCTLGVSVAAAIFAGCSDGSAASLRPSVASPSTAREFAERARRNPTYAVLYNFGGSGEGDGNIPEATLIDVKGTLYGTTIEGGKNNDGTVFSITPSGKESVLHSFAGAADGAYPEASLLNVRDALYGTTEEGGRYSHGTVFSSTLSGMERVIHVFGRSGDGIYPVAGLVNADGTLYGTAANGGANDDGTVFSITLTGAETVLYSFKGGSADGEDPHAGLVDVKHVFYGTTYEGGVNNYGAVFSVTPSGKEKMITGLGRSGDSRYPVAGVLNVRGTLYGTTLKGGVNCVSSGGCGTVFAVKPSGALTVLHSFGGRDGLAPYAGLVDVNGTLYGTTEFGGANCTDHSGCGTVFAITTSGNESVVHSFGAAGDGGFPEAGLLNLNGTLYGTTSGGGAHNFGTVFSLKT